MQNFVRKSLALTVISFLIVLIISFSAMFSAFSGVSFFASAADVQATNENDLRTAVAGATEPTIITIMSDIDLTATTLTIPAGADITLKSVDSTAFCKLSGAYGKSVITVNGKLTLDGVILTHFSTGVGNGVTVNRGGTLIMIDGEISDNRDTNDGGGGVYVVANGASFTMYGGVISNNIADQWGGGVNIEPGSTFSLYGGVVSNNKANGYGVGGGVCADGVFEMFGGEISGNTAIRGGGGVYSRGQSGASNFTMVDGLIFNNSVTSGSGYGGGVAVSNPCVFTMKGGKILDNTAPSYGGGVYISGATFNMTGTGILSGNNATDGGGVYLTGIAGRFNMTDSSVISGNLAKNNGGGVYVGNGWFNLTGGTISYNTATQNGGGIWVTDSPVDTTGLERLTIDGDVTFSNNIAFDAYDRDPVHDSYYIALIGPDVIWSEPFIQGYNNYDISYISSIPEVLYNIEYNSNTGIGSMDKTVAIYDKAVTLKPNAFSKTGYTFTGWNTAADGTGISHTDAETFSYIYDHDLELYAQWSIIPVIPVYDFSVMYVGNGATSGNVPIDNNLYTYGVSVFVAANTGSLVRSGYTFMGWAYSSTAAVADFAVVGNSVSPASFQIYDDATLYAVWIQNVYAVSYEPGTHGTFTVQITKDLHYGDVTPTAPAVTGDAGWNFTGWSPTPSATITGNATYVAQWTQITTPTSPPPSPSATVAPPSSPLPSSTPTPSVPSVTLPPSVSIVPPPILTTTPFPPVTNDKWAFVNLVLSILGVILAVIVTVCALLLKKKGANNVERKSVNSKTVGGITRRDDQNSGDVADETFSRRRNMWLIVSVVLAVVGVVVFLFTEDLNLTMGWVDKWTIVNAAVFVINVIVVLFVFKQTKSESRQK
ncbi:MAG: InlB B-repeat-containing protein [Candidatus Bathyarchaeota archaeon]|nr:InlB B-repeat-containing protein [Candidatus Termiticorpusculum sp.]